MSDSERRADNKSDLVVGQVFPFSSGWVTQ